MLGGDFDSPEKAPLMAAFIFKSTSFPAPFFKKVKYAEYAFARGSENLLTATNGSLISGNLSIIEDNLSKSTDASVFTSFFEVKDFISGRFFKAFSKETRVASL